MAEENETVEQVEQVEDVDTTTETVETVEDVEQVETVEEAEEVEPDLVAQAIAEKARLTAELEALKNSEDGNIFEQNAILKSELEDAKKLQEMVLVNAALQASLDGIKRETIIKSLNLTEKMTEWADSLTFKQLEEFATMTPRRKTILDVKNPAGEKSTVISDFKEKQEKSRIM